jgi:hypothetical protein
MVQQLHPHLPRIHAVARPQAGGGMTATAYERILDKLEKVKRTGTNKAVALCPAHDDSTPALAITHIEGRVLVWCHAGCRTEDVLASIELRMSDLFDDSRGYSYQYADGAQAHRRYDQNGKKKFYQTGHIPGAQTTLYRLEAVQAAVNAGQTVYLVEGRTRCSCPRKAWRGCHHGTRRRGERPQS